MAVPTTGSRALAAIAAAHSCVVYLRYAGLVGRTDQRAALAPALVTGEVLVFTANGFRCPLTDIAEAHGADRGSATDLLLPAWFARNLPAIHVPILLAIATLHGQKLRRRRRAGAATEVSVRRPGRRAGSTPPAPSSRRARPPGAMLAWPPCR